MSQTFLNIAGGKIERDEANFVNDCGIIMSN